MGALFSLQMRIDQSYFLNEFSDLTNTEWRLKRTV